MVRHPLAVILTSAHASTFRAKAILSFFKFICEKMECLVQMLNELVSVNVFLPKKRHNKPSWLTLLVYYYVSS